MSTYNHEQGPPNWLVGENLKDHTSWVIDLEGQQVVQIENFIHDTDGPLRILPCQGTDFDRILGYIRKVRNHIIEGEKKRGELSQSDFSNALKWAYEEPVYGTPTNLPPNGLYCTIPVEDPLNDDLGLYKLDDEDQPWWHIDATRVPFKILAMSGNPDEVAPLCDGEWLDGKLQEANEEEMIQAILSV